MNKEEHTKREVRYKLSRHAKERLQQRGIPLVSLETMLCYGKKRRRGYAYVVCMDKQRRKLARARLAPEIYRRVADKLDFYLIYDNGTGTVITVGHRLDRLKW
ncbi:MAG: hypothetical protein F4W93_01970 [Dehalococcoidia bacterium]|nr:hypothetical protein [Dehalococcoidia bacterium]